MTIYGFARALNNHAFFLALYAILLALALIPYYTDGSIILGGEGDYVLDFSTHLSKYSFAWFPTYGVGLQNMAPSGTGLNVISLWLIEKLTGSEALTNFALIFSIYFFPFFAMYLLCKELKATPFVSFACSLFYVVNPFMLYYLINLNQWNVFSVSVMPLFLWIILKYYHSSPRLFFLFGLLSVIFSFAYTNQPLLVIIHISIFLSTCVASYYHNKRFLALEILGKYAILFVSFALFNSWWILTLLATVTGTAAQLPFTQSLADTWLNLTVGNAGPIIAKTLSLTTIIGKDPSYDFFAYWYNTTFARFLTLLPLLIVVYFALVAKDKRIRNALNTSMLGLLLAILFFVKGNAPPLGQVYTLMFENVPLFFIFKTPIEKFGLLYLYLFAVLFLFVIREARNHRYYMPAMGLFLVYLVFCSAPVFTGNLIPDYRISGGFVSRKYKDKAEYKQFREKMNEDNREFRVLSMPGVGNYQVLLPTGKNKYYSGLDPVLMNTNKPFIATQNHIDWLYENTALANYRKLLSIYNIRKVVMNEDLVPWFGTVGIAKAEELRMIFGRFMTSKTWGNIVVYDNQNHFLPRIYVSNLSH